MMYSLDCKVIERNGLTIGEVLLMIAVANNVNFSEAHEAVLSKGLISTSYDPKSHIPSGFFITNKGRDILNGIILDSDKKVGVDSLVERIESLVPKLQELYPQGKNFNNQYWRGNKTDIKRKLQIFFKKYGENYTDEQVLRATKSYVEGFNGDYKFMRLLQYFIWKEEIKDGTKVPISELANYIENADQTNDLTSDWTSTLA